MLIKNGCNENIFIENMFDPEFFTSNNFPNNRNTRNALSAADFFGEEFIYGPLYDQMAIVEMQLGSKKIFRGNLHSFTGKMTFFPIVNFKHSKLQINRDSKKVTVCCFEGSTGFVLNSSIMIQDFDPEKFHVDVTEFQTEQFCINVMSDFVYDNESLKIKLSDSVIRSRWVSII